jgi:hypothetical protein
VRCQCDDQCQRPGRDILVILREQRSRPDMDELYGLWNDLAGVVQNLGRGFLRRR